ncbi:MAG: DUF4330 domain-containing protein [Acidobacteriota bacterium]
MIDKEGKLFGKVNILDLVILLGVLALLSVFVYKHKTQAIVSPTKTVTLKVVCPYIYPPADQNIKVGDYLVANSALVDVKVTAKEVRPALTSTTKPDGAMVLSDNPLRKDIFLTLVGKTNAVTPGEITLGGQKVRAGKDDYVVKTQTAEYDNCSILSMEVK